MYADNMHRIIILLKLSILLLNILKNQDKQKKTIPHVSNNDDQAKKFQKKKKKIINEKCLQKVLEKQRFYLPLMK